MNYQQIGQADCKHVSKFRVQWRVCRHLAGCTKSDCQLALCVAVVSFDLVDQNLARAGVITKRDVVRRLSGIKAIDVERMVGGLRACEWHRDALCRACSVIADAGRSILRGSQ